MQGQTRFNLDTDSFFTENTWQKQPQRSSARGATRPKKDTRKPLAGLSTNTAISSSNPLVYESRLQNSCAEPPIRMADPSSHEKPFRGHAGGESLSPHSGDILSSGLDRLSTFMMRGSVAVTQAVEKFVERTATDFATTFDMADAIPTPDGKPRSQYPKSEHRWEETLDSNAAVSDDSEQGRSSKTTTQQAARTTEQRIERERENEDSLRDQLKRLQSRCTTLKLENASLRKRLAAERGSEDSMSEQMRVQTELLLRERSQLTEENRSLMRELAHMHELMEHLDLMNKTPPNRS